MKYWLLGLILSSALPAWGGERTLLVVGDSLSAAFGIPSAKGWVHLLQQRLNDRGGGWKLVNASISGDTTAGGLARLPRLLEEHAPRIVVLELGSNDGLRGFGFPQIRGNIDAMIEQVRAIDALPILIGGRLPPNYGAAYAEAFHTLFLKMAEEQNVPLVPFLLEGVARDRSLMLSDGYHPAAVAQPRLLANVWPVLEPVLDAARN